jgi:hypothetical protein
MSTARTLMKTTRGVLLGGWLAAALCSPAGAQTSTSFKLTESVLNAGGNPLDDARPTSASFRISHDAIGDAVAGHALTSASYRAAGGFVIRYRPAGEVHGVRFTAVTSLSWDDASSAGTYNLYRNTLASLPGDFGGCYQSAIAGPACMETATPASGSGWFYLVTAENVLRQEGSKGHRSDGTERPNAAPCQ